MEKRWHGPIRSVDQILGPGPARDASMKPGDRVSYTRAHCQILTAGDPYDPLWQRRGTVEAITLPWVRILWDGENEAIPVALGNIALLGSWDVRAHRDNSSWVGYQNPGEKRSSWKLDYPSKKR